MSLSGTGLTGRSRGPLAPRRGELLELGPRRLIVRLGLQDGPELVGRLGIAAVLREGEGQVEARDQVAGVDLDRPAEGLDRLAPFLLFAEGDTQEVVDVREIGAEDDRLPQRLDR